MTATHMLTGGRKVQKSDKKRFETLPGGFFVAPSAQVVGVAVQELKLVKLPYAWLSKLWSLLGPLNSRCRIMIKLPYLERQWLVIMGYFKPIMVYFGV